MKNKPDIRFDGFNEDWEQCKLIDIVNRVNKSSNSNVLPKVEFEDIVSGEGRLNKDVFLKLDDRKGILFEPENILYGKLRPYLKNWLFPNFSGVALGDFWVFKATNISVPSFDFYLIQSDNYQKVANDTSGTKMPRSDWKKISATDFAIPGKQEQHQIGVFFQSLDNLITLHQRELENYKLLKKGFLQKLFPSNGDTNPSIRFDGFTDAWEQEKLGNLGKVYTGNTPPTADLENWTYDKEGHVWVTPTDIDKLVMNDSERHLSSKGWSIARTVPKNSVLITSIASIGKNAINTVPVAFNQQINAIVPEQNDAYFILSYMVRDTSRFAALAGHTATAIINKTTFEKFTLMMPSLNEQTKIGSFFKSLDNLITLHQRELDNYKELKKGFLQKMFV
ncbi:restriction endonuclease subunit S [Erysipelothrix rhusiopathiae]|nr:restriction endonuclease subunit S [Erysipelothrix rhusiopathiae]MDE8041753.1 restriction endonuclease subunit S [Erysipelothrix rhusiopathiae]MDE8049227.1 restriction endonuclease subunit S [Erysipelothrix rhusiopathiae]MDE8057881.1 restriction endonuclease subunit S [Erysipelothrix rhusiopathiae]MDE8066656.1 restriction endonuclease subunit S [Erysipelothrix rhusiopathiae]